jgi:hypothetical protein
MVMIRNKISKENCSVFLHGKEDVHYDIVKVNLSLCLFNGEGVLGSGGIAPRILDLGTRWR